MKSQDRVQLIGSLMNDIQSVLKRHKLTGEEIMALLLPVEGVFFTANQVSASAEILGLYYEYQSAHQLLEEDFNQACYFAAAELDPGSKVAA